MQLGNHKSQIFIKYLKQKSWRDSEKNKTPRVLNHRTNNKDTHAYNDKSTGKKHSHTNTPHPCTDRFTTSVSDLDR